MKLSKFIKVLLLLPLLAFAAFSAAVEPNVELRGEALINALRQGGFNLYFRHAATDWSQQDQVSMAGDWSSCDPSRMRQLSEVGRSAASVVGEAIRVLRIPVGKVLASPYCRTVETAQLMGLGAVETTTDVMNLRVAEYFGGRSAIVATAQTRLAMPPTPGSNTIIVAHGNVAQAATPVYPQEGEGIVFQPNGAGDFRFVGRLTPDDWKRMATGAAR